MKILHEAFDPSKISEFSIGAQSDLLQLSSLNAQLAEHIKQKLIGAPSAPVGAVDLLAGASWTPAESYAQQVGFILI